MLIQRKFGVIISRMGRHCAIDVAISNVVTTLSIQVQHKLHLLSNAEATFEQRCNTDIVASTSLQRRVLVLQRCDLTTTLLQCCVFAG